MYSFQDIHGKNVPFEGKSDLELDVMRDFMSKRITAYLVRCGSGVYEVTQEVYEALDEMK